MTGFSALTFSFFQLMIVSAGLVTPRTPDRLLVYIEVGATVQSLGYLSYLQSSPLDGCQSQ